MTHITRRGFVRGTATFSSLGVVARSAFSEGIPFGGELRDGIRALSDCAKRYHELDCREIVDARSLRAWQTSYDCMCGAADAVRHAIMDETIGRDAAIEFARHYVLPSCDRAILYWQPLSDLSRAYAPLASAFSFAREQLARSYAAWPQLEDDAALVGRLIDAERAIRDAIPITRDDRRAARRVIESLNNDDMVDVSIIRATLEEHEVGAFRKWARSCGSFSCARCNAWLGDEGEAA